MKIERFEDIEAWKEARVLVQRVYQVTREAPFKNDWGLSHQIQRAAVSIMSNIAEGFVTQTNKEFIVFLGYSLRSTAEVQSQLYAALDLRCIEQDLFDSLTDTCTKIARLLQGFIRYLKTYSRKPNRQPQTIADGWAVHYQPTDYQPPTDGRSKQ